MIHTARGAAAGLATDADVDKGDGEAGGAVFELDDITDSVPNHLANAEEESPLLDNSEHKTQSLENSTFNGTESQGDQLPKVSTSTSLKSAEVQEQEVTKDNSSVSGSKRIVVEDGIEYEVETFTLEAALQKLLHELGVERDVWARSDDKRTTQISFLVELADYDHMLKRLTTFGIGTIPSTSVSTFPASFHRLKPFEEPQEEDLADEANPQQSAKVKSTDETSEFWKSIKARLTVTEVVERIKANSLLTFDFLMLIVLASIVAGLGLAENSSVVLVASMLISPLMGPILGWTFGTMIGNRELWIVGVRNEIIGLVICLVMGMGFVVGFILGLLPGLVNINGAIWGSTTMWPTPEMKSRGLARSLWVGVLIALPSGAGVALSILGGNAGSLVGVAISASLLPPAVNAGMLWAYSLVSAIHPPPTLEEAVTAMYTLSTDSAFTNGSNMTESPLIATTVTPSSGCPRLENNDYVFAYSCSMPVEALILGTISLLLTILNILCIFLMGVIVLKMKEVVPGTAATAGGDVFWKKDIKIARDAYKTLQGKERMDLGRMAKEFTQEVTKNVVPHSNTVHVTDREILKEWKHFLHTIERSGSFQEVIGAVPSTGHKPFGRPISLASSRRIPLVHSMSVAESESPTDFFTPTQSPETFGADLASPLRKRNVFFPEPDLNHSPSTDSMKGPTATYVMPSVKPSPQRRPRGFMRMPSCPSRVMVVPSKTKTTKGRFLVTPISEEDESVSAAGSRRGSFQPAAPTSAENMV